MGTTVIGNAIRSGNFNALRDEVKRACPARPAEEGGKILFKVTGTHLKTLGWMLPYVKLSVEEHGSDNDFLWHPYDELATVHANDGSGYVDRTSFTFFLNVFLFGVIGRAQKKGEWGPPRADGFASLVEYMEESLKSGGSASEDSAKRWWQFWKK